MHSFLTTPRTVLTHPAPRPTTPANSARRDFLASAVAAAALATLAGSSFARLTTPEQTPPKADKPLRILILGGTGFLGPAIVDAAKTRGHTLTLFNRGQTEKRIGIIDGVEKLNGNRDPNLRAVETDPNSPLGLAEIDAAIKAGATWDAVVDTSGYVPRIVKASADLLAQAAAQYVFISTISVYSGNATPDADESAPLEVVDPPDSEDVPRFYGGLKALCEQAAAASMPGKVTNIRPGFIVGPGDPTDRFTYWPVRAAGLGAPPDSEGWGPQMLAPGAPEDPFQAIDVRDLANFVIHCIERKTVGDFNATSRTLNVGDFLAGCSQAGATHNTAPKSLEWVTWDFLQQYQQSSQQPLDTTVIIPPLGEVAAFHRRSVRKAHDAGLVTRPVAQTCADTLAWWPKEVARRDRVGKEMTESARKAGKPAPTFNPAPKLRVGMLPDAEIAALVAWNARPK